MAYLVTCAGSKQKPANLNSSRLDQLSYYGVLLSARDELIKLTKVNLEWSRTLPAWQLYSGKHSRLYPQISTQNWNKSCVEIKILSALFGWINHTDFVRYYNLKMTDTIANTKQQIWRFWFEKDILKGIVHQSDIDLLSQTYRKAINGQIKPVAIVPNISFRDYGTKKGKWLNR